MESPRCEHFDLLIEGIAYKDKYLQSIHLSLPRYSTIQFNFQIIVTSIQGEKRSPVPHFSGNPGVLFAVGLLSA